MKNITGTPQEHKTFNSYLLKTDQNQGIVESIVAVMGNIDQGDDVIHNGAFTKTMQDRFGQIKVLDQHQTDSILRVLGKPIAMREMSRDQLPVDLLAKYPMATGALYTKTQYNLQTDNGRNAFNLISAGDVSEYSIGYDPVDVTYSKVKMPDGSDKTVRDLRQLRLYEYSPVIWAMNSATSTLSAKGATGSSDLPLSDRARAWDSTNAENRVRVWADATEAPNAKYRDAFFWYDGDAPDNFTSYKLQFADVIDGKLTAIPRGIFAVAAVLQGSRGGVDIPQAEQDAVKSKVSAYYARMRKEFDDDSIIAPWEAKMNKEAKPWNVFREGDKWNVYKLDADGKPTGDRLGSHDSEEEARVQVRALYANEGKAIKAARLFTAALTQMVNERNLNEMHWHIECALRESLDSIIDDESLDEQGRETAMRLSIAQYGEALIDWYKQAYMAGLLEQEHEGEMMVSRMSATQPFALKSGRVFAARNMTRLQQLKDLVEALLADAATVTEEDLTDEAPAAATPKRAANPDAAAQAGPMSTSPTIDALMQSIEIELAEIKLMEV